MNTSDLIHPRHLQRRAMIYVRQSTPQQVTSHQESQRLQYALRDRAVDLGWHEQDVEIIDVDLGHTASTTEGRVGFQHLVSEIALGRVGVVIAYDATRLARNCSHWYQLLDLCGRTDCLIADRDGIYDPCSINGRLLLGLKGQISELELHTIRARLLAGLMSKATRGELAIMLPVGLVRNEVGLVEKHPDREVQDRVNLVFDTLVERKSIGKVVRYFNQHGIMIPRQNRNRRTGIAWKRANIANVGSMVRNPAYAGAFAYGRRKKTTGQTPPKSAATPAQSNWRVLLHDRYPAYITWDKFETIEAMLRDNYAEYDRNKTRGIPREGKTLLHGIVYCGECGHKMCVQYKGTPKYLCNRLRQISPGDPVCQYMTSDPIDAQVVKWFFEVLSSASIDASQQALQAADGKHDIIMATRRQQLTRLRYQAQLAERQYQQADPDNRLVAAELEQRWEFALRELKVEEERYANDDKSTSCWAIPSELLDALKDIGPRLPEIWEQGLFTTVQKKQLLRSLIDKVVMHRIGGRKGDRVHVRVVWRGGTTTSADVDMQVAAFTQLHLAKEMEQRIVSLSEEGHLAPDIARQLTAEGYRSPKARTVLTHTVRRIRQRNGFLQQTKSRPVRVSGCLTISQLADKLTIRRGWFIEQIKSGRIRIKKDESTGCYLFPNDKKTLTAIKQLFQGKLRTLDY